MGKTGITGVCQTRQDLPLKLGKSTYLQNACPTYQIDMLIHSLKVLLTNTFNSVRVVEVILTLFASI